VRFLAILVSWKFAMNDPRTFITLFAVSSLLGAIDGTVARVLK